MAKETKIINFTYVNEEAETFLFEYEGKDFDLVGAIREAADEYLESEEGREEHPNADAFSWCDVLDIPQEICEKHGFTMKELDTELVKSSWDLFDDSIIL